MNKNIEIMAPAGSYEALMAAINAGAGSVYFGIENLNMRTGSAHNFTTEDLKKIAQICKENNVQSYLTVNTIVYDEDVILMKKIIQIAKESGVSAIIASDIAAINYANEIGVEVHISTQLNVTNYESVKYFAKFADVIVLARELNLNQVKSITDRIKSDNLCGPNGKQIKIEMFVHGALCMAVSGKCYLSLHEWNKSANRGNCLQTCRRGYTVTDNEDGYELEIDNEYIMSPKDLKTIHFLNKILDAGVEVLKIEGRGRSADYVKRTVECYSEAVAAYFDGTFSEEKIADWDNRLSEVFNRGFWDGYYLGQKLGEWSSKYGSSATTKKIYIGKITNYFKNIQVAELMVHSNDLKIGDKYIVMGSATGVYEGTVDELRIGKEGIPTEIAIKGDVVSFKVNDRIRPNDKLYKVVQVESEDSIS